MEKKNKEISISKQAFERCKKTWPRKSLILSILVLIYVACLILAFFLPSTLILTIPFIVVPATFAFQSVNTVLELNINSDSANFFFLFRLYFQNTFHGSYRLLRAFLFSLIYFFVAAVVVSTIGSIIIEITNPALAEQITAITDIADFSEMMKQIDELILNNQSFINVTEIAIYSSFGAAFIFFVHSALVSSIRCYLNLLSKVPMPVHDLNVISSETMKKIKRPFKKDYYKSLWFVIMLFVLGYVGGCFFARLCLNLSVTQNIVVGFFVSVLLTFFFIPYYFDVTYFLFNKYSNEYHSTFIKLSLETLKEFKKTANLDPEKEEEIKKFIDSQQQETGGLPNKENKDGNNEKNHD